MSLRFWGREEFVPAPPLPQIHWVLPHPASPMLRVGSHGSFPWSCLCRGCPLG